MLLYIQQEVAQCVCRRVLMRHTSLSFSLFLKAAQANVSNDITSVPESVRWPLLFSLSRKGSSIMTQQSGRDWQCSAASRPAPKNQRVSICRRGCIFLWCVSNDMIEAHCCSFKLLVAMLSISRRRIDEIVTVLCFNCEGRINHVQELAYPECVRWGPSWSKGPTITIFIAFLYYVRTCNTQHHY